MKKIVEAYNEVWEKWRAKQEVLHNRALDKARAQQAVTDNLQQSQAIKSQAFGFDSDFSSQPVNNGINGLSFKENAAPENNRMSRVV